jgi:hypothetical protein
MVIEQLYPEYVRPVAEGRLAAGASQALFVAFRDKALSAKACFEAGLHNQGALAQALAARCVPATLHRNAPLLHASCCHSR